MKTDLEDLKKSQARNEEITNALAESALRQRLKDEHGTNTVAPATVKTLPELVELVSLPSGTVDTVARSLAAKVRPLRASAPDFMRPPNSWAVCSEPSVTFDRFSLVSFPPSPPPAAPRRRLVPVAPEQGHPRRHFGRSGAKGVELPEKGTWRGVGRPLRCPCCAFGDLRSACPRLVCPRNPTVALRALSQREGLGPCASLLFSQRTADDGVGPRRLRGKPALQLRPEWRRVAAAAAATRPAAAPGSPEAAPAAAARTTVLEALAEVHQWWDSRSAESADVGMRLRQLEQVRGGCGPAGEASTRVTPRAKPHSAGGDRR